MPSVEVLEKVADMAGESLDWLFGREDKTISNEERRLLRFFRGTSEEGQEIVLETVEDIFRVLHIKNERENERKGYGMEEMAKSNGYCFFMWASHPLADSQGRVLHHRFVASLKIGRWVTSDEHVHHIDGNKLNNTPDNLEVLSSREHAKLHFPGPAPKLCLVCGKSFVPTKPSSKYCSRS